MGSKGLFVNYKVRKLLIQTRYFDNNNFPRQLKASLKRINKLVKTPANAKKLVFNKLFSEHFALLSSCLYSKRNLIKGLKIS